MKTNDVFSAYEREERIVKLFSLSSIIVFGVGIVSLCLSVIFDNPLYDTISVWTIGIIFIFPVVLLQFFMSAGIYQKGLGYWYLFFYLLVFPCADVWFFSGIDVAFDILPNPRRMDLMFAGMTIEEYRQMAGEYILGTYLLFNGAGLLYRIGKDIFKKRQMISSSI